MSKEQQELNILCMKNMWRHQLRARTCDMGEMSVNDWILIDNLDRILSTRMSGQAAEFIACLNWLKPEKVLTSVTTIIYAILYIHLSLEIIASRIMKYLIPNFFDAISWWKTYPTDRFEYDSIRFFMIRGLLFWTTGTFWVSVSDDLYSFSRVVVQMCRQLCNGEELGEQLRHVGKSHRRWDSTERKWTSYNRRWCVIVIGCRSFSFAFHLLLIFLLYQYI